MDDLYIVSTRTFWLAAFLCRLSFCGAFCFPVPTIFFPGHALLPNSLLFRCTKLCEFGNIEQVNTIQAEAAAETLNESKRQCSERKRAVVKTVGNYQVERAHAYESKSKRSEEQKRKSNRKSRAKSETARLITIIYVKDENLADDENLIYSYLLDSEAQKPPLDYRTYLFSI